MTVTVDGAPFSPPPFAPAWTRRSFPQAVGLIRARLTGEAVVEVVECDGTVFRDVLIPFPPDRTSMRQPGLAPVVSRLVEVAGSGFLPGEDVAVAPVTTLVAAGADGTATALVPTEALLGREGGEVALIGRTSGTLTVVTLAARRSPWAPPATPGGVA